MKRSIYFLITVLFVFAAANDIANIFRFGLASLNTQAQLNLLLDFVGLLVFGYYTLREHKKMKDND